MTTLIKAAKIIDSESPFDNKIMDLLIENGSISRIAPEIPSEAAAIHISFENLHISPGWFDSSVSFGEPGFEERENIENGLKTAAQSGFTAIALNSTTSPVTDTKAGVAFLKERSSNQSVAVYPVAALTRGSHGNDLAELFDMQQAGAVAFGDYQKPLRNPNMLKIALQYSQNIDALIQSFPQDNAIAGQGQVNEGVLSTRLGLKGIPALAEELQVARDIFILEYTGGKLHIPTISTAKSVQIVRDAKERGLDISCSVAIHHLFFTDQAIEEFDTTAKVMPPLRTKADVKALLAGVRDGTIDMITSDHFPVNIEHKKVEFDHALFGTIGMESALGALLQLFSVKTAVRMLTAGKSRFNIPEHYIDEGAPANFTCFNPEHIYTFSKKDIQSSSDNSIFLGHQLKGKVLGIFSGQTFLDATEKEK